MSPSHELFTCLMSIGSLPSGQTVTVGGVAGEKWREGTVSTVLDGHVFNKIIGELCWRGPGRHKGIKTDTEDFECFVLFLQTLMTALVSVFGFPVTHLRVPAKFNSLT